jgi:hypothetical protein
MSWETSVATCHKISFCSPKLALNSWRYIKGLPMIFSTALLDAHLLKASSDSKLYLTEQKHKTDTYTSVFRMAHVHSARALGCRRLWGASVWVSTHGEGLPRSIENSQQTDTDGQTTTDCGRNGLHENTADAVQFRILGKLNQCYKYKGTRLCPYGREHCSVLPTPTFIMRWKL